jgi:hypothetical protein
LREAIGAIQKKNLSAKLRELTKEHLCLFNSAWFSLHQEKLRIAIADPENERLGTLESWGLFLERQCTTTALGTHAMGASILSYVVL